MTLVGLAFWALLLIGTAAGTIFFEEEFDDDLWSSRWIMSTFNGINFGTFNTTTGTFYANSENKGLQTTESTHLYALSSTFPAFTNENRTLVLQYSAKYEQDIGEFGCAGGYIKLFNCSFQPTDLHGGTPHVLAFGPDICGNGTKRVLISISYKNEIYSFNRSIPWKNDIYTHVYTLIVKPDQTFQVLIDSVKAHSGSFLDTDWNIIPKKIKDPNVTKPSDWDDRPTIPDRNDTKPKDWDQPMHFCPCNATANTTGWDNPASLGAPIFINPYYKGEWEPRQIPNPAYMGPWIHPEIDNPEYMHPDNSIYRLSEICGIGFELWQGQSGTIFDNLLLTDSVNVAAAKREDLLNIMKEEEKMKKLFDQEETTRKTVSCRTE